MSELGSYIKELRKKMGLSLGKVAQSTGFSRSYIYYIEEEKKKPNPTLLRKLAELYRVRPDDLFVRAGYLPGPLSESAEERLRHLSRQFEAVFLDNLAGLNEEGRRELEQYLEYISSKERYRKT